MFRLVDYEIENPYKIVSDLFHPYDTVLRAMVLVCWLMTSQSRSRQGLRNFLIEYNSVMPASMKSSSMKSSLMFFPINQLYVMSVQDSCCFIVMGKNA